MTSVATLRQPADDTPAGEEAASGLQKDKLRWWEAMIIAPIFIFPMFGVFQPLEIYFGPKYPKNVQHYLYAPKIQFFWSSIEHQVTLFLLGILCLIRWKHMLKAARLLWPIWCFIGWAAMTSLWSLDPDNTWHRILRLMDHVIFGTYITTRLKWKDLVGFIIWCIFLVFVLSCCIMVVSPRLGLSDQGGYLDAWRGAFTEKNGLGAFMSVGAVICAYALYLRVHNRWFTAMTFVGSLALLMLSRSATSNLAFFIDCAVVAMLVGFMPHHYAAARFLALATLVVGAIGLAIFFINLEFYGAALGRSSDLTGRTEIWHYVAEAIWKNPIKGYGYGFWFADSPVRMDIWNALGWTPPHAHNEMLDVVLQTGLIGLLLELLIWAISLFRVVRYGVLKGETQALVAGLIIINFLVRSVAETIVSDPAITDWIWLIMSFLSLAQISNSYARRPMPASIMAAPRFP